MSARKDRVDEHRETRWKGGRKAQKRKRKRLKSAEQFYHCALTHQTRLFIINTISQSWPLQMKGRAHLDWLQLLQLNKCGWMIISFPPRNKRKRRQCWIITLSKTIKSDFEVAAPPNLSHISAAEMASWAQPAGAVGPLRLGPRGRAPAHSCVQRSAAAGLLSVFPPTERLSPQRSQEASQDPPPASKPAERGCKAGALVLAHH